MIYDKALGKISAFFLKGHERTLKAKKNIAASFIIKGLNIAIGLILVPLTINYLSPTKYGIWVTLSSIIGWFGFFDIGLGHGLRNRFAEAIAMGKHELARIYVSTTYAILSIIILAVLFVFLILNPFLNWNSILNAGNDPAFGEELSILAIVVFTFFCLSFVFKLITTVLTADQQPAKASFFDLLGKMISLLVISILIRTTHGSLLYLGIAMSGIPVLVLVLSSIWFYRGKYRIYRPAIRLVDFSKAPDLLKLGTKFFVIQIASIVLYQTNTVIISQLFGPAEVTPYNVAFKYFSVMTMGFSIIISPFWSAFTDAWAKKEIDWVRKTMQKLIGIWGLLVVAGIIMVVASKWIYKVWVGDTVAISYLLSALVAAWVLLNAWNSIFSHFLNGLGKIKLQIYIGISTAVLNIPLAVFLGKRMGIEGLLIANVAITIVDAWVFPLQYYKLINNKARGIWNK